MRIAYGSDASRARVRSMRKRCTAIAIGIVRGRTSPDPIQKKLHPATPGPTTGGLPADIQPHATQQDAAVNLESELRWLRLDRDSWRALADTTQRRLVESVEAHTELREALLRIAGIAAMYVGAPEGPLREIADVAAEALWHQDLLDD